MINMKNTLALILFALISTLSIAQQAARMNGEILVMLNDKTDITAIVNQVNLCSLMMALKFSYSENSHLFWKTKFHRESPLL